MIVKDKAFAVMDLNRGKEVLSMAKDKGQTYAMAFAEDETRVYVGICNYLLGFDLATGKITQKIRFQQQLSTHYKMLAAVSQDNGYFAAGVKGDGIYQWLVDLNKAIGNQYRSAR